MRSKVAKRILAKTPKEVKKATELYVSELIKIDRSLDKYDNMILFPEKVEKAKEAFANHGVPDFIKQRKG